MTMRLSPPMWVSIRCGPRQAYPLNRPRQWLTSGGLGTMGFGLPAAIGAALANPDRKVLCFSRRRQPDDEYSGDGDRQ
ncbi:acetolactate synthase isozyme I large subunit [Escherichia coli]|uniref:Acetolactate synthase isozyme I large subunit n=1 Tax=Escherichia coli TaxID=562 RepID=A0A376TPR8_ECOLX|nr:acetolactate synthase isozyme I large subunit [Escherichia coli]